MSKIEPLTNKGVPPGPRSRNVSDITLKNGEEAFFAIFEYYKYRRKPPSKVNTNKWIRLKFAHLVNRWRTWTDTGFDITMNAKNNLQIRFFLIPRFVKFVKSYNKEMSIISTAKLLSLTIYLKLLRENVESNPGMPKVNVNSFSILTYNCNGLGDRKKLKRLLVKLGPIVERGGIILLQETHITDTSYLSTIWGNKFESNCNKTNSAGVITLFGKDLEIVEITKDSEGRQLIIVVKNENTNLIISNSYLPNDHKQSIKFVEELYLKLIEKQHKFPEYLTIAAGDYNAFLKTNDSLNRISTKIEKCLAESIISNNRITNLVDSYRELHNDGGFTWRRGTCYSRLDYIFLSAPLARTIMKAENNWSFESSDHATVMITLKLENNPQRGPGITKVNTNILDDPTVVKQIAEEVKIMLDQTDDSWNPHTKLEFLKVVIRTVFSAKVADHRKNLNLEISEIEDESNELEVLRQNLISVGNKNSILLSNVDTAISKLRIKLLNHRAKLSKHLEFKSKTKWFEYGEKSNKFFLNLTKSKQNQKLISNINCNGKAYVGQGEVTKGIKEFYEDLYSAKKRTNLNLNDKEFYKYCPKLTKEQAQYLDNNLTLAELTAALKTCKNSSPGPDGIPYDVYKSLWHIAGPIIYNSWNYTVESKTLPPSHFESIITLLPKDGKDAKDIKNWRPITLSNCDSKIITKALANKISTVLETIIDVSQTAYVPGRSVADNLRSNFYMKQYCENKNLDSVLISLDAKKAFDSVDHKYIEETLRAYGFGSGFIKIFKTLYRDIRARILVNGFQSESLKIERGVK